MISLPCLPRCAEQGRGGAGAEAARGFFALAIFRKPINRSSIASVAFISHRCINQPSHSHPPLLSRTAPARSTPHRIRRDGVADGGRRSVAAAAAHRRVGRVRPNSTRTVTVGAVQSALRKRICWHITHLSLPLAVIAAVAVCARSVIKLMLQFCKENNLHQTMRTLQVRTRCDCSLTAFVALHCAACIALHCALRSSSTRCVGCCSARLCLLPGGDASHTQHS